MYYMLYNFNSEALQLNKALYFSSSSAHHLAGAKPFRSFLSILYLFSGTCAPPPPILCSLCYLEQVFLTSDIPSTTHHVDTFTCYSSANQDFRLDRLFSWFNSQHLEFIIDPSWQSASHFHSRIEWPRGPRSTAIAEEEIFTNPILGPSAQEITTNCHPTHAQQQPVRWKIYGLYGRFF